MTAGTGPPGVPVHDVSGTSDVVYRARAAARALCRWSMSAGGMALAMGAAALCVGRSRSRPMICWAVVERCSVVASEVTSRMHSKATESNVDRRASCDVQRSCMTCFVFISASLRCVISRVTHT